MALDSALKPAAQQGLWQIEDVLDAAGNVALPPAITLISLIERNIANVGDTVAYRYLDHTRSEYGDVDQLTWTQLGARMRAIGAEIQRFTSQGDRVAVLAPQGLDYVAGFFAAIKAGTVAVPLFAPEMRGHAERLAIALHDSRPAVVLTTSSASAQLGTRFGLTKETVWMCLMPVSDRASMNSIFCAVEIGVFSIWKPSRGPSSLILTFFGKSAMASSCWTDGSALRRAFFDHSLPGTPRPGTDVGQSYFLVRRLRRHRNPACPIYIQLSTLGCNDVGKQPAQALRQHSRVNGTR